MAPLTRQLFWKAEKCMALIYDLLFVLFVLFVLLFVRRSTHSETDNQGEIVPCLFTGVTS